MIMMIFNRFQGKEKRYLTLDSFLKQKFGGKIIKLAVDGGFTCPNRDGSKGFGGCIFCSTKGSGDFIPKDASITKQMQKGVELIQNKWKNIVGYIAYFQSFSNTYAPIRELINKYDEALAFPGVVGLAIATRPDCIDEQIADLLFQYSQKTFLWVELGLQSAHKETMDALHLGYNYCDFVNALRILQAKNIPVCVHVICGLPGESIEKMKQTVNMLAKLNIWGIKFHMLHVIEGTVLGMRYENNPFRLFSLDEYAELIADLLELLPSSVIIHRLTGDGPKNVTLAPRWTFHKLKVLSEIDRVLKDRNSWQGKLFENTL